MNQYLLFVVALIPIVFLVVMLGFLNKPAHKTVLWSVLIASVLAIVFFQLSLIEVASAILEGASYGFWPIMVTIIGALFTYNLAVHTNKMDTIKKILANISSDSRIQVLVIAWAFGGFLEGVAGYGTAVALPASLLALLGFDPMFAAVLCLIANTTPTAFGAVGIPVSTLADLVQLDVYKLGYLIAIQSFIFTVIIPFVLVALTGKGLKALKGVVGITLVSGLAFALPQIFVARTLGAQLPSLIGGVVSLAATIMVALLFYKDKATEKKLDPVSLKEAVLAWLPYILIVVLIVVTLPMVEPIFNVVDRVKTNVAIYQGNGAVAVTFKWLTTPGTIIIVATLISGLIQGCPLREIFQVFVKTVLKMKKSIVTVLAIVALAKIMDYSGMVNAIAIILVAITGPFFPVISPIIGGLGTFITGSDTSANLLFGSLQTQVASSIQVSEYWLAAANTTGATLGKMISPQSIAVAATATNLVGKEGEILKRVTKYCFPFIILLGVIVYVGSFIV